jgi:hypothetical protein
MDIYSFKQLGVGQAKVGRGEEGDWASTVQLPGSWACLSSRTLRSLLAIPVVAG